MCMVPHMAIFSSMRELNVAEVRKYIQASGRKDEINEGPPHPRAAAVVDTRTHTMVGGEKRGDFDILPPPPL